LASGWIYGLFAKDEIDGLLGGIGNDAKANGIPDTPECMLTFLISRVQMNLHVVLCFFPVGDVFRARARRFPALIMVTAIDFFHAWPRAALISVAHKVLEWLHGLRQLNNQVSLEWSEVLNDLLVQDALVPLFHFVEELRNQF